jgi:flagellar basal-body rod protein FlgF
MDSGFYAACSGLVARMQALEVLAHDLANVGTPGYKARHQFFAAFENSLAALSDPLNQAMNRFGILGGAYVDFREGSLEPTGNPLDVAIEGPGFFVVQTAAGVRYTRNGALRLNARRVLVTAEGDPVLGTAGPLIVPEGKLDISGDGTVSVNGAQIGRLQVVEFPAATALVPEGNTYFAAPTGSARPARTSTLRPGTVEDSNMNPVLGTVELVAAQRTAQMLERALGIFNNDLNRTAEQIGRV